MVLLWGNPGTRQKAIQATVSRFPGLTRIATRTSMVNVWSTGSLARGSHRVRIVLSSSSPAGKYLTLDAVDIWGTIASR